MRTRREHIEHWTSSRAEAALLATSWHQLRLLDCLVTVPSQQRGMGSTSVGLEARRRRAAARRMERGCSSVWCREVVRTVSTHTPPRGCVVLILTLALSMSPALARGEGVGQSTTARPAQPRSPLSLLESYARGLARDVLRHLRQATLRSCAFWRRHLIGPVQTYLFLTTPRMLRLLLHMARVPLCVCADMVQKFRRSTGESWKFWRKLVWQGGGLGRQGLNVNVVGNASDAEASTTRQQTVPQHKDTGDATEEGKECAQGCNGIKKKQDDDQEAKGTREGWWSGVRHSDPSATTSEQERRKAQERWSSNIA